MKKNLFFSLIAAVLIYGCTSNKDSGKSIGYGIIQNPSAEITDGSVVKGWTFDPRARNVIHFYDNVAHEGTKSLFINADRYAPAGGAQKFC